MRFRSVRQIRNEPFKVMSENLMPQASGQNPSGVWRPAISVVVPVRNEVGNIAPLVTEIAAALQAAFPERAFEIVYVNDGSSDGTEQELLRLMALHSWLRQIKHAQSCGQSAAVRTGVAAAHGDIVTTIDGDGQNDPAFIPKLIAVLEEGAPKVGLVAGQRVGRKATGFKKVQSRVANAVRNAVLKDGTRDTGCGLKAFRRDMFLGLPYFDGLHRFLPALVRRDGFDIGYVDVVDRQRHSGVSNYGFFDRLWVGILDLAGVWWLVRRKKRVPQSKEINLAR
jgi:dolichol-phosphate mannosyltransferase